jgi:spore coat polysaccharide biosynthesis protein SpsF
MKIVATIEARMTSSRLPGKVLKPLGGQPALQRMIERIRLSRYVDEICIATTTNKADNAIIELAEQLGVSHFRGSEEDVLIRVLHAAYSVKADLICELTGDCPLIDPYIIDQCILSHLSGSYDYSSTFAHYSTYPIGFDTQVFPVTMLERVAALTKDPIDHVHVSCFIYHNPKLFRINAIHAAPDQFGPDIRLTVDTPEDYELIAKIFDAMDAEGQVWYAKDIVKYLKANPELLNINRHVRKKALDEG